MQLNRNSSLGSITAYAAKQAKALVDARAAATAGEMAANGASQLARTQAAGRTAGEMAAHGANRIAHAQAAGGTAGAITANGAHQLACAQVDQFKSSEVNRYQSSFMRAANTAVEQPRGFCGTLQPPNLKLPAYDVKGSVLKYEAMQAKSTFDQTVRNATADGHVSFKERQDVNAAGRKLDIAETRVDLHEAGKAHRSAVADAVRDRRITPDEGRKINDAQNKIQQLDAKLKGLEFWNRFEPSPTNPVIGSGGTREAQTGQPAHRGEPAAPGTRPGEMRPREGMPQNWPSTRGEPAAPGTQPGETRPRDVEQPRPKPFLERLKDLVFPSLPEFPKPPVLETRPLLWGKTFEGVGKRASSTGNVG